MEAGGCGGSSVGAEPRQRSVFRTDSPDSDCPSSCRKAAAIPTKLPRLLPVEAEK